jgi:hypothetical protein
VRKLDTILAEALALSEAERARLALSLAESLTPAPEASAWPEEIVRRVAELRAGTAATVSAGDAVAAARAQLASRRG